MLEDIAIKYMFMSEGNQRIIGYATIIIGAIAAALFHKSIIALHRAPYFVYFALLIFLTVASQLVWLGSVPALESGNLWILISVNIAVGLTVGYVILAISMARSRDAYGHRNVAAMAFLPIANFWLFLTPSQNDISASPKPTIPLISGVYGVVTGFGLLAASAALSGYIHTETGRMVANAQDDPEKQGVIIEMMLKNHGLEKTLGLLAADVSPQRVDENTNLVRVEGDGSILRYIYEVTINVATLPEDMQAVLLQHNCSYPAIRPVIYAGATLEHVYRSRDETEIGTFTVTREICGF